MTEPLLSPREAPPLAPATLRLLPPEQEVDQELTCRRVVRVTHDVSSFVLEPTRPGVFAFLPGQYLTLTVKVDGRAVERCYTISSPPTRPHLLTITVKRTPGGVVSGWLHDQLRPGGTVHARGPLGEFTPAAHPAGRYLFLSAGSGITPAMSMLRTLVDLAEPADVVFLHSARTPDDIPFRQELEALDATDDRVSVTAVCEADSPTERWSGWRGRLRREVLHAVVPDVGEREVFTCGPEPYMSAVRTLLAEAGVDPARCHEESFVLDATPRPVLTEVPQVATGTVSVEFRRSNRVVPCPAGSTVLEAATQAGVMLPSSCQEGLCGTCKTTLLEGSVDMNQQGGIRPREIAQGRFLPCCSTPLGDLVVDA